MGVGDPVAAGAATWGVLGGTFDPIHLGHLAIAESAREELGLAGVLFVPARVPPHKSGRPVIAAEHRAAMVQLAIADNPAFEMSRLELDRTGPSYTVETLRILRALPGAPEYVFILSADAARGLPSWREPATLLALCRVAVVPRLAYPTPTAAWIREHFRGQEDRFLILAGPELGHASSDIRRRAQAGRSIRYLVPAAVAGYIRDQGIYASEA